MKIIYKIASIGLSVIMLLSSLSMICFSITDENEEFNIEKLHME